MWIRWVLVPKSVQPGGFWHGRCAGLAREDVVLAVQVHLRMGYAPSNAEQKAVEAARARTFVEQGQGESAKWLWSAFLGNFSIGVPSPS